MANPKLTTADATDYEFLVLAGSDTSVPQAERVIRSGRAGVDGSDYTLSGKRAVPFTVRVMADTNTRDEGLALIDAYRSLKGTLVTYTDEHLKDHPNVMVLDVRCILRYRPFGTGFLKSYGQSNYVVEATFTLERTD